MRPYLLLLLALLTALPTMAQDNPATLQTLEDLSQRGRYRSALEVADRIYAEARRAGDADRTLKALFHRASLTQQLEEDGFQAAIDLLREAATENTGRPVMGPVTDILLAEAFKTYARQNSYRLRNTTATTAADAAPALPLSDYTLPQLAAAVQFHANRAVTAARANRTPLREIPDIIGGDQQRFDERPTLYDLVVPRVLDLTDNSLLSLSDQRPNRPDALLLPAAQFCDADLPAELDPNRATHQKLSLYQDWLCAKIEAGDRAALAVADLQRLEYLSALGATTEAYRAALLAAYENYQSIPEANRLLNAAAQTLPPAEALPLYRRVDDSDPVAAQLAAQRIESILEPSISLEVEATYATATDHLFHLGYRNVDRVYLRVYPYVEPRTERYENPEEYLTRVLRLEPIQKLDVSLPDFGDYQNHATEYFLETLPYDKYLLLAGDERDFDPKTTRFSQAEFRVSDLSFVSLDTDENAIGLVLDRQGGNPRPRVRAQIERYIRGRNSTWEAVKVTETDEEGTFELPQTEGYVQYRAVLTDGDDRLVEQFYAQRNDDNQSTTDYSLLLSERGIYRPGQTAHIYGLSLQRDSDGMPTIVPNRTETLTLYDANYQEVASAEVTGDEFGRYSHSFVLPESGLTGNFQVSTSTSGSVSFRVEEYKRPRFLIEMNKAQAVRPGAEATVTGTATTLAGPALAEATVRYRVNLKQRPRWWYYGRNRQPVVDELLTSGETTTGENGTFTVSFDTRERLPEGNFYYEVAVDVVDQTGETHTDKTRVGILGQAPTIVAVSDGKTYDRGDEITLNLRGAGIEDGTEATVTIVPVKKPFASLKERYWGVPDTQVIARADFERRFPNMSYRATPEDPAEWPAAGPRRFAETVDLQDETAKVSVTEDLPVGHYRITVTPAGGTAGPATTFAVVDRQRGELPEGMLYDMGPLKEAEVGQTWRVGLVSAVPLPQVMYLWGSRETEDLGFETVDQRETFSHAVTEGDRGGLALRTLFVRFGRVHMPDVNAAVAWKKDIDFTYATFRDNLKPGTPERWTVTVGQDVAALATMYDASLDEIAATGWNFNPYPVYRGLGRLYVAGFGRSNGQFLYFGERERREFEIGRLPELSTEPFVLGYGFRDEMVAYSMASEVRPTGRNRMMRKSMAEPEGALMESYDSESSAPPPPPPAPAVSETDDNATPAPNQPQIRKKLGETAFFQPELTSDADGNLQISFDSPEALTTWKFRLFAHDKELNYGFSEREVVTRKELMVLPNVPRFVREGDEISLTAKVSNQTEEATDVDVRLELFDPATNAVLGAYAGARDVQVGANASETVSFPLDVGEELVELGAVGYRVIASSDRFSDGEENLLPVLTDRTLVTVSQPFYVKRGQKKKITLAGLTGNDSETLRQVGYSFQATTQPAWIALKALPYLMEYPYDCTEQVANRFFANQLAFATVSSKPILEDVFRAWQADSSALDAELRRNPTLKNALLTETPWVRAANDEAAQRARIVDLFDLKRLAEENQRALDKLKLRQGADGAYSWFPNGRPNRYMTQYVVETLGRVRELGAVDGPRLELANTIAENAIRYLDGELSEDLRQLERRDVKLEEHRPSAAAVHYLYARSVFDPEGQNNNGGEARAYFRRQAKKYWLDYGLYEQALLMATAARQRDDLAGTILTSLRERAIRRDEFGMYWKYAPGYRWHNLPIETHCRILEAFRLAGAEQEELDEMRLWLLTNKRTSRWSTTKATAAAVYALLNANSDYLSPDSPFLKGGNADTLTVKYPGPRGRALATKIQEAQRSAEAATGTFTFSLLPAEVDVDLATVTVENDANDLVWGGVYWQYTELASKVAASADGPLRLSRQLFRRIPTDAGERLQPLDPDAPLAPGDRVTVRLTLRSDRDLDYVHLKDRRAATLEPIEQTSGYRYENGLAYYFAPGDLATNFFIDALPKGTYTLEYDLFATYEGTFSNGLGRVQCMYAPEFGANTEGGTLRVEN